jgi:AcrR family transcriptional regulator
MNVRDQLLVAAARVYAEGGYHGATTRRIASAAGVNEITLFRHFGTKDVLLREALARCRSDNAVSLPQEPSHPLDELTEWCRSHFRDMHARAPLIRTALAELPERPGVVSPEVSCPIQAVCALTDYLGRLRQLGLASGRFDPRVAATMLMGVLFSDAIGRDIVPQMFANEPEDALRDYVALFLRGIGVEAGAKGSPA